jgi:hypothetical protein
MPNELVVEQPSRWQIWLVLLLLAVLFTPRVKLPGEVPLRIDDFLVFTAGATLTLKYFLGLRVPRLDVLFWYTVAVVSTILWSTLTAPSGLDVTAKEYLDCLRPLKFFLVYWIVCDCNRAAVQRAFIGIMSSSSLMLLAILCVEMSFARVAPGGIVVRFFSAFTEKSPDLLIDMMAARPFATFNTPPDLGYVACVCLFAGPLIESPSRRRIFVAANFLILLITATRMLLFSLPLLLTMQAFLRARNAMEAYKRLRINLVLIAVAGASSVILLPMISPHASDFTKSMIVSVASGDTRDEDSISTRLGNLYLVDYTSSHAPIFGVGSRALLPEFVDSELILTYHRYGLIGLTSLLLIYPLGFRLARQVRHTDQGLYQFAVMALVTTFLSGITSGTLDNSRTGVLLFLILGMVRATKDQGASYERPLTSFAV